MKSTVMRVRMMNLNVIKKLVCLGQWTYRETYMIMAMLMTIMTAMMRIMTMLMMIMTSMMMIMAAVATSIMGER